MIEDERRCQDKARFTVQSGAAVTQVIINEIPPSINVFGDVYPCECTSTFRELCIGNINNHSFEEMFRGDHYDIMNHIKQKIEVMDGQHAHQS